MKTHIRIWLKTRKLKKRLRIAKRRQVALIRVVNDVRYSMDNPAVLKMFRGTQETIDQLRGEMKSLKDAGINHDNQINYE